MASRVPGGLATLKRQILKLSPAAKAELIKGHRAGAQELVGMIRSRAPRRTGELAKSVDWCVGDPPATRATGAIRSRASSPLQRLLVEQGLRTTVYAGNDKAFYARWVDKGTKAGSRDHTRKSRRTYRRGKRTDNRSGRYAHPGTKATYFWSIPISIMRKRLKGAAARAINKAAKVARGG